MTALTGTRVRKPEVADAHAMRGETSVPKPAHGSLKGRAVAQVEKYQEPDLVSECCSVATAVFAGVATAVCWPCCVCLCALADS